MDLRESGNRNSATIPHLYITMDNITKGFVIAACTVFIAGTGIWTYNWYQTKVKQDAWKAKQDAWSKCADRKYELLVEFGYAERAHRHINSCLAEQGFTLKD